jgi:antitoxin component YwqK of YwqJK toxin-antitoxin module
MEGVYADIDSLEFLLGKVIWQGNGGYYVGVTFEGGYFDDEKKMQITGIDAYRKATEKPIKDGKWTYYYESGKIEKEEFYEFNLILKTIYYSEKGFKTSKIEYGLKEGWLLAGETKYYENGTIKSEDFDGYEGSYSAKYYENGLMEWEDFGDGEIKTYYENGKKKHSLIDGLEEYYYKNGQIKKTIEIGDDYKLIEEYSEIGKLTKEEIYLSNNLQKEFKEGIWMNGILIFEKDYQLNPSKDERFRYYKKKLLK